MMIPTAGPRIAHAYTLNEYLPSQLANFLDKACLWGLLLQKVV